MANLGNYVKQNISRFVKMKPGGVVVLRAEVYGDNAPVEETFYTKREYNALMSAGRKRLRKPTQWPVGGGVKKDILAYEIPRTLPSPMEQNNDRLEIVDAPPVNPEEARQLGRDLSALGKFCLQNRVNLLNVQRTNERGKMENMYIFSDGLGGYTIDAVRKSVSFR